MARPGGSTVLATLLVAGIATPPPARARVEAEPAVAAFFHGSPFESMGQTRAARARIGDETWVGPMEPLRSSIGGGLEFELPLGQHVMTSLRGVYLSATGLDSRSSLDTVDASLALTLLIPFGYSGAVTVSGGGGLSWLGLRTDEPVGGVVYDLEGRGHHIWAAIGMLTDFGDGGGMRLRLEFLEQTADTEGSGETLRGSGALALEEVRVRRGLVTVGFAVQL